MASDGHGGTLITDPPASQQPNASGGLGGSIDLSNINFDNHTTLGYSAKGDNTGGAPASSGSLHAHSLALLGQYAASSFVMASDSHGGTPITDPSASQQPLLTLPHA